MFKNIVNKKYSKYISDPDTHSPLLQEIYKILWTKDVLQYCIDKDRIHGDTMNSIQTTLNWFTRDCYEECEEYYGAKKDNSFVYIKGKLTNGFAYIDKVKSNKFEVSIKQVLEIYCREQEFFIPAENNDLIDFIKYNHTLGNFIPVPVGCNGPRGLGRLKDYWDLTLNVIYDYYVGDDHISDITGKSDKLVQQYRNWLDSFKGDNSFNSWAHFVEKNYMQDFVELDSERKYGMPKELWRNHFSQFERDGKAKPNNKEQAQEFFFNASDWIMKRSNRMIQELKGIKTSDLKCEKLEEWTKMV